MREFERRRNALERVRLAAFLLVALARAWGASSAADAAERAVPGQALVVLKNWLIKDGVEEPLTEAALASVEGRIYVAEVAHAVGARVVQVYEELSIAGGTVFALFASERQTAEQLIEALKKRPEVLAVSPNRQIRAIGSESAKKVEKPVSADKKAPAKQEKAGAEKAKAKKPKAPAPKK